MSDTGPVLPAIVRIWKLVRLASSVLARTTWLAATVRSKPVQERDRYRTHLQHVACNKFLKILGVEVENRLPKTDGENFISVSNHLGILDPLVISAVMPVTFSAKSEMADWPIAGWISRTVGIIFVHRDRRMATSQFVQDVRKKLTRGIVVHTFPEGTTSDGTSVRTFRTGAFAVAEKDPATPILPFALVPVEINNYPISNPLQACALIWADDTIPMLKHFWGVLGLKSAKYVLASQGYIRAHKMSRKALAAQAQAMVLEAKRDCLKPPVHSSM